MRERESAEENVRHRAGLSFPPLFASLRVAFKVRSAGYSIYYLVIE